MSLLRPEARQLQTALRCSIAMLLGRASIVALCALAASGCRTPPVDDCQKALVESVPTDNPPGVDVAVDLSAPHQSGLTWGPLHGMDYRDPVDRAYADAASVRLDALNPKTWRVGGTKDPGGSPSGFGAFHPFVTHY